MHGVAVFLRETEMKGETKMKKLIVVAGGLALSVLAAKAAPEYTIRAPNGIGDVVSLTNVLATMETGEASLGLKLWLEPGVYDLRGVQMATGSHLYVRQTRNAVIAGLGQSPADTVLLGGGESDKCRVACVIGGGTDWTTVISNLTVTGGYADKENDSQTEAGSGGGIYAGNSSVLYDTCIISNNVALADASSNPQMHYGGGGCFRGCARNCIFADNTTTGAGGGISTAHRKGSNYIAASIVDCVFTNNSNTAKCYTITWDGAEYGGGGGAALVPAGARVVRTWFLGNSARSQGGALCVSSGEGMVSECTFVNNYSSAIGGAVFGWAAVTNCTFTGNESGNGGGAIYVPTSPRSGAIVGCRFYDNKVRYWHHGGAVLTKDGEPNAQVFDSVFSGNQANDGVAYGHAAYKADLFDCVVSNHVGGSQVLSRCNLTRCRIQHNMTTDFHGSLDHSPSIGAYTNLNCEFSFNRGEGGTAGKVSVNKVNINCTYLNNVLPNINYGQVTLSCPSFNCIFSGNIIGNVSMDVRARDMDGACTLVMTNCLFNKADSYVQIGENGYAEHDGMSGCRRVADMKLKADADGNLVPSTRSPAYNAGFAPDWLLAAVGEFDLAHRTRVFGNAIDIGAFECQRHPPGTVLLFR